MLPSKNPAIIKHQNNLKLNPKWYLGCIYGQMTGNCYSERAAEILNLCAAYAQLLHLTPNANNL